MEKSESGARERAVFEGGVLWNEGWRRRRRQASKAASSSSSLSLSSCTRRGFFILRKKKPEKKSFKFLPPPRESNNNSIPPATTTLIFCCKTLSHTTTTKCKPFFCFSILQKETFQGEPPPFTTSLLLLVAEHRHAPQHPLAVLVLASAVSDPQGQRTYERIRAAPADAVDGGFVRG